MDKPSFFISSTIYDFRDLRSALKFWLEKLGYEVMLSEFNDFPKDLDENSLLACLKVVEKADYYILFIGARVGYLIDQNDNISVTRMEYRTAYQLMQAGRMHLLIFVRQDLWTIRNDRKALRTYLLNDKQIMEELAPSKTAEIVNHSSGLINDPEIVFDFLTEVTKDSETNEASLGKAPFPKGNWVHPFSSFDEIINALQIHLNIAESLSQIALKVNLKQELISILMKLAEKHNQKIRFSYEWGIFARKSYTGDLKAQSLMPGKYLRWLCIYIFSCGSTSLPNTFIQLAISSGEFLQYDHEQNLFKSGPINDALVNLTQEITKRHVKDDPSIKQQLFEFFEKYKNSDGDEKIPVNDWELLIPFALIDRDQNIANLSTALLKALDGDLSHLEQIVLQASSPSQAEAEKIKNETPTAEEMTEWVNSH